jgi:hypothetical protein
VGSGVACTHGYCPARLNAAGSLLSNELSAMSKVQVEDLASSQKFNVGVLFGIGQNFTSSLLEVFLSQFVFKENMSLTIDFLNKGKCYILKQNQV